MQKNKELCHRDSPFSWIQCQTARFTYVLPYQNFPSTAIQLSNFNPFATHISPVYIMGHPIHSHTCTYLQQINRVELPLTESLYIRFSLNYIGIYTIPIQVWQYKKILWSFWISCHVQSSVLIFHRHLKSPPSGQKEISAYLPPV